MKFKFPLLVLIAITFFAIQVPNSAFGQWSDKFDELFRNGVQVDEGQTVETEGPPTGSLYPFTKTTTD